MFVAATHGAAFPSQGPGDLWYFPPGIPHSLQGTSADGEGTEFLLVRLSFESIDAYAEPLPDLPGWQLQRR